MSQALADNALATPILTPDPGSLIGSQASAQGNAPKSNVPLDAALLYGQSGGAQAPNLTTLVSDKALDAALNRAGIQTSDPKAREHLRNSLREANEYAQLELSDPKYIEHSAHMGIDPNQTIAALALIEQKRAALDRQVEDYKNDLIRRDQSNQRAGNWGAIGFGAASVAGVFAASSKKLNGFLHKENAGWKRIVATVLGSAVFAGAMTWLGGKIFGGGKETLMEDAQNKAQEYEGQLKQLDMAEVQLLEAEEFKFTDLHLQRSFQGFQDGKTAAALQQKPMLSSGDQPHSAATDALPAAPGNEPTKPQSVAPAAETLQAVSTDGEPLGVKSGRGAGDSITMEPSNGVNIPKVADGVHNEPPYSITSPVAKDPTSGSLPPFGTTGLPRSETAHLAPESSNNEPPYSITSPVAKDPTSGSLPPFGTTGLPRSETAHLAPESAHNAGDDRRNVPSYAESAVQTEAHAQNEVKTQPMEKGMHEQSHPTVGENRNWTKTVADKSQPIEGENRRWV